MGGSGKHHISDEMLVAARAVRASVRCGKDIIVKKAPAAPPIPHFAGTSPVNGGRGL